MHYIEEAKKYGYAKFNWIHCTKKGEEIPCEIFINKLHLLDDNGEELFVGMIHDMREHLADYKEDESQLSDRFFFSSITDKALFNIVTELSNEWFFSYDILNSKMQFFGTECERMQLPRGKHVFPDEKITQKLIPESERELFFEFVEAMRSGVEKTFEINLKAPNGEQSCYRFVYQSIRNEKGVPIFAVGKTYDISEHKTLENLAQKDLLTDCYNKISTEQLIEKILVEKKDSSHAVFFVDIDDFKSINDNLGHAFGDNVLREIGNNLHHHFRDGDIIGRIGGDEFLVFLKNMNSIEALTRKAQNITRAFKNTYTGETKDYKVSGSVGIALYPNDGSNYKELFQAADKALYRSKLSGKDCYTFYSKDILDGTMSNLTLLENVGKIADAYFDSDFVANVFELLYEMRNNDTSLELLLEYIGKQLKVDRCYIFESYDEGKHYTEKYEWCNEGIEPEKEYYQNITKETIGEFVDELNKTGVFYCNDFGHMQTKNAFMAAHKGKLQSVLLLQTKDKEQDYTRLFIGFDDCKTQRVWTEKEINSARYILKMISIFILCSNQNTVLPPPNEENTT